MIPGSGPTLATASGRPTNGVGERVTQSGEQVGVGEDPGAPLAAIDLLHDSASQAAAHGRIGAIITEGGQEMGGWVGQQGLGGFACLGEDRVGHLGIARSQCRGDEGAGALLLREDWLRREAG